MTTWATQLERIRYYLRDPEGNLWSEALLRALWEEAADDLQARTGVLERVRVMPVPPRWQVSVTYDWEWAYRPETGRDVWWALRHQGQYYTHCAPFEAQAYLGVDAAESDYGVAAVIHPWEAWYALPGAPVPFPWPDDLHALRAAYYDEEPIEQDLWGQVVGATQAWSYVQGIPDTLYRVDVVSPAYFLTPRPSTDGDNELSGTGPVSYVDGDTLESEYGEITRRTTGTTDSELGVSVDVVDAADNVLLVYVASPSPVTGAGDELEWPDWICKYLRAGVLERAYRVQGDGQIESLAAFWGSRYELGLQAVNRYKRLRCEDRVYCLATREAAPLRTRQGPRLPSGYPAL